MEESQNDFKTPKSPFNIWDVYSKVVGLFQKKPDTSLRSAAEELKLSKSSVQRHKQASKGRNKFQESHLWDTAQGQNFLLRLVVATLLVFGIQRGIGANTISFFFQLLRINTHIGVSPTALLDIIKRMEKQILKFKGLCKQKVDMLDQELEIIAGVDETFFEQMILILMDLKSGFIFF